MHVNITTVLTSCGRLDLLEKTITSLPLFFWHRMPNRILIEDSGDPIVHKELIKQLESGYLQGWTLILNPEKIGQGRSIDKAYSMVDTEFIFHMEDDWEFFEYEFVRRGLIILDENKDLVQVTMRRSTPHKWHDKTYGEGDLRHNLLITGFNGWPGYTYNPSIFRTSCYHQIKPIGHKSEKDIGLMYNKLGLMTAITEIDSVRHIGDGRHVF